MQDNLFSHWVELRQRLVRAGLAILLLFFGLVYWAPHIFHLLAKPLLMHLPEGGKMMVTDVTGSFFVPIKVTLLVAFILALPFVLYQIWAFIAPALYPHERKGILPLVSSSYILFLCGMAFAYFVVFPVLFQMMAHYNAPLDAQMSTDIDRYVSFTLSLFLAFGITFEIPLVVILCVRIGLISTTQLKKIRPYIIVGAFVLSAIITPPDVFSQLLLAIPLVLLYELGLLIARFLPPASSSKSLAE
jgi:sec-independent protein translocase protein TatC